jgi:hypothetical protein
MSSEVKQMRFVMTTKPPTMLVILDTTVMIRRDKILSTSSTFDLTAQTSGQFTAGGKEMLAKSATSRLV